MILILNRSKKVLDTKLIHGWEVGARDTNIRNINTYDSIAFVNIYWKNYNFDKHIELLRLIKPTMTVGRDMTNMDDTKHILNQA